MSSAASAEWATKWNLVAIFPQPPQPSQPNSHGLPRWVIYVASIGGAVVLTIVCCIGFRAMRKRRDEEQINDSREQRNTRLLTQRY